VTEDRIQLVLDGRSNPLVGVVDGIISTGYRMSLTAANGRLRERQRPGESLLGDEAVAAMCALH
jgi:hypothetical protein